jgi:DNA-binding NarL/FixJ family response regulator
MKLVRILLADDHPVVLDGLLRILDLPGFVVLGTVSDGRALVEAALELEPDLILADISMPVLSGIAALRELRKRNSTAKVIVLTMHPDVAYALEAFAAGALGFVLKSAVGGELLAAVRAVMHDERYIAASVREAVTAALEASPKKGRTGPELLSPRQRQVLRLLAQGLLVKEVAARLNVSPKTIEFHKQQMKRLLGIHSVAELAVYAARHGITD